ncbi:hypothetical protein HBI67_000190 [Parastagonospora nodorum]|nr:hypothetical protein HBI67_000190 [Parastagonospora nodorum]KAH6090669.1 hypothetical protein HBI66_019410 [Parastagonospora nodorum]KAH6318305.1 hypothetical protein HBI39_011430 [Parastagonospora nodorum]KAH6400454.1 hypothetical protein HBI14_181940 [Parastagonospora nodorum]
MPLKQFEMEHRRDTVCCSSSKNIGIMSFFSVCLANVSRSQPEKKGEIRAYVEVTRCDVDIRLDREEVADVMYDIQPCGIGIVFEKASGA